MENVAKRVEELCKDSLVGWLGMEFVAYGEGWLTMKMPVDHRTCRPDGALHGGANMALAETTGGVLSLLTLPPEMQLRVYGIEINGNHVRRAEGDHVIARAEFLHRGKRTHVVEVRIHDAFGNLVTVSRVTNMIMEG